MKRTLISAAILFSSSFAGAQPTIAPPAPVLDVASDRDLASFVSRLASDRAYVERFFGIPWSERRLERIDALLVEWQQRLAGTPFDSLDQQGKIDYLLTRNYLENERSRLSLDRTRLDEMNWMIEFRKPLQELDWARRRLDPVEPQQAAALLAAVPALCKSARERIELARKADAPAGTPKVTPVLAQRAARALDGVRGTLRDWYTYNDGFKPEFSWWNSQPYAEATKAIAELARFLREDVAGSRGKPDDPLIGDPIGREALLADLRGEHVAQTPEQLIDLGERQLAWCRDQMKEASGRLGLGDDWRAAIEKAKQSGVPVGKQDELVRDQARASIKFLRDRDLLTIPPLCEESWRIEMHSPETQRYLPFAVYGGQYMGVSYPTDSMNHEDKLMSMRGNNKHFTLNVTPHELIPGHHLQGYMADRSRPYRSLFSTPFLIEGWALYWEFRYLDLGWAGSTGQDAALDNIGILFWRSHRAARIIVSLKFHLGQMTPDQMVDFLVKEVGHERLSATSEVRRYIGGDYSPLYQVGYMFGGLQIQALHKQLVASGTMSEKLFHDTILTYNSIPIELIRSGMTNQALSRDTKPSWDITSN